MKNEPMKIEYDEPGFKPDQGVVTELETVVGNCPQVTAAPTWVPRLFKDHFAVYKSGATLRFYVYDSANQAWRYATLT